MVQKASNLEPKYYSRKACAVCTADLTPSLINMPSLPLTEVLVSERPDAAVFLDQGLCRCQVCGHAQLLNVIPAEILYAESDYAFRTSQSQASRCGNSTFIKFIEQVTKQANFGTIVDIGCNDLFMLKALEHKAEKLFGIDPMLRKFELANDSNKIECIADFFENVPIKDLISSKGTLFISSHNLEHIEEPRQMFATLMGAANSKTIFAFQFPGFETLLDNLRFDQVFHHHLHYFSLESFQFLLNETRAKLLAHTTNRPFWGSLLVLFKKGGSEDYIAPSRLYTDQEILGSYDLFRKELGTVRDYVQSSNVLRILGYGAALTLPALAYHMRYDLNEFECIIDDDPHKDGLYYPNLVPQIKNSRHIETVADAMVVITALNNVRQILPKLSEWNARKILLPLKCC